MVKSKQSFAERLLDWFTRSDDNPTQTVDRTLVLASTTGTDTAMPGGSVTSQPPAAPSKRYEIIKVLGKGSYGVVSLARDLRIGRMLAIKQLNARFSKGSRIYKHFVQEARIAGQLDNPNIVTIYDVEGGDVPCILMEHLSGGNLGTLIRLDAPMDELEALRLIRGILNGLRAAHRNGVVHRDIKPSNIIFDQNGTPKVTDFGVAIFMQDDDPNSTTKTLFVGTPDYMSPEQMQPEKHTVDGRADLYSCGLMLFEMLTGERLHRFGPIKTATQLEEILAGLSLPGDSDFPGEVTEGTRDLVRSLIRKDAAQRPANAQAAIDAIDEVIAIHVGLDDLQDTGGEEPTILREMFEDILRLFLVDGLISAAERRELTIRSRRLGIAMDEALGLEEKIRKELQLPSLRHLQEYAWRAESLLRDRDFSEEDKRILDELANAYKISEAERIKIQDNVMVKFQMKEGVVEDLIP